MKKFVKVLLVMVCSVLLIVASIAGTLAYLTSTKAVANTFTAGKVAITLDDIATNQYGKTIDQEGNQTGIASETYRLDASQGKKNTYKLVPGLEYTKDSQIHVAAGSEPCYLFVKIDPRFVAIDSTIVATLSTNKWLPLTNVDNVYYYELVVDASNSDTPVDVLVLDTFTVDTTATSQSLAEFNETTASIIAYAVQKEGLNLEQAWNAVKDTTPN